MSLAAPLPAGSCFGDLAWNPATAAQGQSVLSGVLAGFVFLGIVAVLGVQTTDLSKEAARALRLLFCAFIGLAVVAYLFADQAAESNCLQATAEETLAGGILGTFAIIMIVSLSWLVAAYDMRKDGILRFLRYVLGVAAVFVLALLSTSSYSLLQADTKDGPSHTVFAWIYATGGLGLLYVIALPVARRFTMLLRSPIRHPRWDRKADKDRGKRIAVSLCAGAALAYLVVSAGTDAFVLSTSGNSWIHPPSDGIYLVAWASLVVPLGVLILAWHAVAPEEGPDDPSAKPDAPIAAGVMSQTHVDRPLDGLARLAMKLVAVYGLIFIGRELRRLRRLEH